MMVPENRSGGIPGSEHRDFYFPSSIPVFKTCPSAQLKEEEEEEQRPTTSRIAKMSRVTRSSGSPTATIAEALFDRFTHLPWELQDMIWAFLLPGPRTVKISKSQHGGLYSPCIPPVNLAICKRSRSVATRNGYALTFAMKDAPARIFANFAVDTIYFDSKACPPEYFPLPLPFTSVEIDALRNQRRYSTEELSNIGSMEEAAKRAFSEMEDLTKIRRFGLPGAVWKSHITDLIEDLIPHLHSLKSLVLTFEYDDKYLNYGVPRHGMDPIGLLKTQLSRMTRFKSELQLALQKQNSNGTEEELRQEVQSRKRSRFEVSLEILTSRMTEPWISEERKERERRKAGHAAYKHAYYYSVERTTVEKRAQDVLDRVNRLAEICDTAGVGMTKGIFREEFGIATPPAELEAVGALQAQP